MEPINSLKKTLAQLFQGQSQQQPPPPPPPFPAESSIESVVVAVPSPLLSASEPEPPLPPPPPPPNPQLDLPMVVISFCLTGPIEIASQSLRNHTIYPLTFHLLCLMMVCAFASILVAKYISPKQPNAARLLNHVGIFFGVAAFFFAVTMSFPLCLRVISWIIFALSLIAVLVCNCPVPLSFRGL